MARLVPALNKKKPEFRMYPVQADFMECAAQNLAFIAGRGGGKSFAGCLRDIVYMLQYPGCTGLIGAPCYDDKTEVLTERRGWQFFRNLTPKDRVATLRDNKRLEYQTPVQHFDFPYRGDLIHLNNQELDLAMTPNHRCLVRFKPRGRWQIKTAEELYDKSDWHFKKTSTWNGGDNHIASDYAEFLGFWFAEGCAEYNPGPRKYRVVVTQKKHAAYAEDLVARNFPNYKKDARTGGGFNFTIYNKDLAHEFASYGKSLTKEIPQWIKDLSAPLLDAFLHGFIMGDGHRKTNAHDKTQMFTSSRCLANDLQEIAFKAGHSVNITEIPPRNGHPNAEFHLCMRTPAKHHPSTERRYWSKRHYDGRVYCVEVPNGIIYVRRGGKAVWCGNTYPMLRDTTRKTFLDILRVYFPDDLVSSYSQTDNILSFKNGSTVLFRSLDNPDSARGPNLAFFHLDEAAYILFEAFNILKGTLREPGYPQQCWITTTPKGRNWIFDEWEKKVAKGENSPDDYVLFRARSSDNIFLPPNFEKSLNYSGSFYRQEILGEFTAFEGMVYPGFTEDHIRPVDFDGPKPKRVVAGVDWGFRDPATILVLADMGDGIYHAIDEWYETGKTVEEHVAAAKEFMDLYGIDAFYCDPSRPDSIALFANYLGPIVHAAENDILTGISTVTTFLEKRGDGHYGLYVAPRCINLIRELQSYQYEDPRTGSRKNPGEKPLDAQNHLCDPLRYLLVSVAPYLSRRGFTDWF